MSPSIDIRFILAAAIDISIFFKSICKPHKKSGKVLSTFPPRRYFKLSC